MSWPEHRYPVEINYYRESLAERIRNNAVVVNADTGFIRCKDVNYLTSPGLLREAAIVATHGFLKHLQPELKPNKVVAVQSHGVQFQTAIGLESDLLMPHTERRDHNGSLSTPQVYLDVKNKQAILKGIPSVSKPGLYFDHIVNGLEEGDIVAVADDFCATGAASWVYLMLRNYGITPIFIYIVAKDFPNTKEPQTGYRNLKKEGIPVYATTIFTGISDGKVEVTAEDIN